MNKEDGINAGQRRIGTFFLYAIPLVLGVGASVWLGVYIGVHDFRRELSQEERRSEYVGASVRPKEKLKISVVPYDCTHITKANIDGKDLLLYARNDCHRRLEYNSWHWRLLSPDGVVIGEGYTNWQCPTLSSPGVITECNLKIKQDDRAALLEVWTTAGS